MDENIYILVLGLNHKTAPVEIREKLALSSTEIFNFLKNFATFEIIKEALVVSTCNRVEIYSVVNDLTEAIKMEKKLLSQIKNLDLKQFEGYLYAYSGYDAVSHIFRVTSSLDSMIVGEPQILGQVKEAYRQSLNVRTAGPILNKLMHRAFHAAKRVRTETRIGRAAVSISYAAVELATKIFGSLKGRKVLIIGAGDMGELVMKHLIENEAGDVFVSNRTFSRAEELARTFNGHPVQFENFVNTMKEVDIVICSTGASDYIVKYSTVKEIMPLRNYAPMFFIDISVPRNIEPDINRIENVYLYDIDDLEDVVLGNLRQREKDAKNAEEIIVDEVKGFFMWLDELKVVPTIVLLRDKVMKLSEEELKEALSKLKDLNEEQKEVIRTLRDAIVNKIFHIPIATLKKMQHNGESYIYIESLKKLFELEEKDNEENDKNRNQRQ